MSNIEVKCCYPRQPWRGKWVEVSLPNYSSPMVIQVHSHYRDGKLDYFGVNWPSIGLVDAEHAHLFAAALEVASATARYLTKKYKGRSRR
jgi:hypothetical protein